MAEEQLQKRKGRFAVNWARSGNYILAMGLLYFLFFGFICNSGGSLEQQDPGNKLLFVYTAFFNTDTLILNSLSIPEIASWIELIPLWTSIFLFVGIGLLQSYREDFLVQAVKKNIMMIPFILGLSWIWFAFNYELSIFTVLLDYFTSIHGYLNIAFLLVVYGGSGFIGGALKIRNYQKTHHIEEGSPLGEGIRV